MVHNLALQTRMTKSPYGDMDYVTEEEKSEEKGLYLYFDT